MEKTEDWEIAARLPSLRLMPTSLDRRCPMHGVRSFRWFQQSTELIYLSFGLIRGHIVIIRAELGEESLLNIDIVASIVRPVPVVYQS